VDPRCGTASSARTASTSAELGRREQLLDVLLLFNFMSVELQEDPAFAHYEQLSVLVLVALYPRMDILGWTNLYTVRIKAVRI
jgi:hypothetical protein